MVVIINFASCTRCSLQLNPSPLGPKSVCIRGRKCKLRRKINSTLWTVNFKLELAAQTTPESVNCPSGVNYLPFKLLQLVSLAIDAWDNKWAIWLESLVITLFSLSWTFSCGQMVRVSSISHTEYNLHEKHPQKQAEQERERTKKSWNECKGKLNLNSNVHWHHQSTWVTRVTHYVTGLICGLATGANGE